MATFTVLNMLRATKVYKKRRESDPADYKTLYRFEKHNVEWLADYFLGSSSETSGGAITPKHQMQIFLRYISDPGFQSGVGEDVGCDQTTVSKTVNKVRKRILEKADAWIKFPSGAAEVALAKQEWQQRFKIPCTIGVIDCTHVRISKPSLRLHGDDYVNRKLYPSINVQATSVHDSRIFKNSTVYHTLQNISNNERTVIIGDSGYGIAPWILVPFKNPITPMEIYFNKRYAKDRVIIERCFGQLRRRFPALHYKLRVKIDRVPGMIVSCAVLHNISKYLQDEDTFPDLPPEDPFEDIEDDGPSDAVTRARGQQVRQNLATILYNNRA